MHATWITIAAIVNLVLSAGLIHRFGPDVLQFVAHTERMFSAPPGRPTGSHLQSV